MNIFRKLARPVAFSVIFSLIGVSIQIPVHAAIIGTDTAIQIQNADAARDQVKSMLARSDVQNELIAAGVNPDEVNARVNAMTDSEVVSLSGKLDKAAAGGDALGIALFVFLALILTDLMGWTDIFPFTRKGSLKN